MLMEQFFLNDICWKLFVSLTVTCNALAAIVFDNALPTAEYLSYKSSNIQVRKAVFWSTFEWPPQPCIQKVAPCKFPSHLVVGTTYICVWLKQVKVKQVPKAQIVSAAPNTPIVGKGKADKHRYKNNKRERNSTAQDEDYDPLSWAITMGYGEKSWSICLCDCTSYACMSNCIVLHPIELLGIPRSALL